MKFSEVLMKSLNFDENMKLIYRDINIVLFVLNTVIFFITIIYI